MSEIQELRERVGKLERALHWALGQGIALEPGDSRAVSDEFVTAAALLSSPPDQEEG